MVPDTAIMRQRQGIRSFDAYLSQLRPVFGLGLFLTLSPD